MGDDQGASAAWPAGPQRVAVQDLGRQGGIVWVFGVEIGVQKG